MAKKKIATTQNAETSKDEIADMQIVNGPEIDDIDLPDYTAISETEETKSDGGSPAIEDMENSVQGDTMSPEKNSLEAGVIFRAARKGDVCFMMEYLDGKTNKWEKKPIVFKNHKYFTSDPAEIAFLNNILEQEKHLPLLRKKILTQEEFEECVTPEKVWVEYKNITLHIKEVRRALQIAEDNGWVPEKKEFIVSEKSTIRVKRSGSGAGVLDTNI